MRHCIFLLLMFSLFSCSSSAKKEGSQPKSQAQEVVDKAISFHNMEGLDNASFSFTFREMQYTYENRKGMYQYTRTQTDSLGQLVFDSMDNEGLTRKINGETAQITEEKRAAYTRSVNSVIYFFRLPYGLNDPAVIKEYIGETEIKGKTYHEVKVTFVQEEGGEDFSDVFLYWFDTEDYSMDYLAYLYHTDEGGMRFREAINARRINGVLVQDYLNYKPDDETMDIMKIEGLYKADQLEVLSEIINEKVEVDLH